jgi:hypothetical protein
MEIFDDTFVLPALADVWFAASSCPACRTGHLRHVTTNAGAYRWACEDCGRCWEAVRGRLRHVDPIGCPGCATKDRRACIVLLQRRFRRFGPDLEDEAR